MQKRPIPFTDPYGSRYLYQMPQRCSVSTEILSFAPRTERLLLERKSTVLVRASRFSISLRKVSRKREKRRRINREENEDERARPPTFGKDRRSSVNALGRSNF